MTYRPRRIPSGFHHFQYIFIDIHIRLHYNYKRNQVIIVKELFVLKKVYLDPEFKLLSLATSSEFLSTSQPNNGGTTEPTIPGEWGGEGGDDGLDEWS